MTVHCSRTASRPEHAVGRGISRIIRVGFLPRFHTALPGFLRHLRPWRGLEVRAGHPRIRLAAARGPIAPAAGKSLKLRDLNSSVFHPVSPAYFEVCFKPVPEHFTSFRSVAREWVAKRGLAKEVTTPATAQCVGPVQTGKAKVRLPKLRAARRVTTLARPAAPAGLYERTT